MAYTPQQVLIYKVLSATLPPFVFIVTTYRFYVKGRDRWWWDDLLLSVGIIVMIAQQATVWGSHSMVPGTAVPLPAFYFVVLATYTQVWLARLSILSSVLRFTPDGRNQRIIKWIAAFFVILYVTLVVQLISVCQTHQDTAPLHHCNFTKSVPVYQFIAAMVSDVLLITIPLRIIRLIKDDNTLLRRLQFIFIASILTTIASLTQSILNILNLMFAVFVAASLEAWVSLLVCSLGVMITVLCRTSDSEMRVSDKEGGRRGGASQISFIQFSSKHKPRKSTDDFTTTEMDDQINPGATTRNGLDTRPTSYLPQTPEDGLSVLDTPIKISPDQRLLDIPFVNGKGTL